MDRATPNSLESRLRAIRRHRRAASMRAAASLLFWGLIMAIFALTAIVTVAAVSGRL